MGQLEPIELRGVVAGGHHYPSIDAKVHARKVEHGRDEGSNVHDIEAAASQTCDCRPGDGGGTCPVVLPDHHLSTGGAPACQPYRVGSSNGFRDVGVQVDIRQQDLGTVLRSFVDRSFDMYLYGGGNFRLDPDFICLLYCSENFYPGGANLGHYSNDRLDALLGAARRLGRTDLRARVYADVGRLLLDEVPNLWLWLADTVYAVQRNVTGFQPHTNYETMFWNGYAWGVSR